MKIKNFKSIILTVALSAHINTVNGEPTVQKKPMSRNLKTHQGKYNLLQRTQKHLLPFNKVNEKKPVLNLKISSN